MTGELILPRRPDRRPNPLLVESRAIGALVLRGLRLKFRESRLNYLLAIAEPCLQFAVLYGIFWIIGRRPGFGDNLALFLASGMIPFFLFMHMSNRITNSFQMATPLRALRVVSPLNLTIANGLIEFFFIVAFMVLTFSVLAAFGVHGAIPVDPLQLICALVALGLFSFGVGLINSAVYAVFRIWALVYGGMSRLLFFCSGVFYVLEFLPPYYRDLLFWNPVMHGVSWFRSAIYPTYPQVMLDRGYLLACGLGAVALGVVLDRAVGRLLRR